MKDKIIAATVAGGLLVGAGFITASISTPGVASAQEDDSNQSEDSNVGFHKHGRHGAILADVLADLVEDGTITQGQADAIVEALAAKADAFKAEAQELRELIESFLDDDVITEDELAQLPDDHPFNNPDGLFADALEDGQLTLDELQESRPSPRHDAFRRGARLAAILDDGGIDQAEYDSLGEDHFLKKIDVSDYLDDGVISLDELKEIWKSQTDSGDAA